MAKQFPSLDQKHCDFITAQKIFFAASATDTSRINLSPRPSDCLRIANLSTVMYLDNTGSGSETVAHLQVNDRLTIMLCSFDSAPQILRLYGHARSIKRDDAEFEPLISEYYEGVIPTGARQIIQLDIDLVQTSCGFGVPFFQYQGERDTLTKWAEKRGVDGIRAYWQEKNRISLDGLPTGLGSDETPSQVS
ncbi:MAG: pyridoxamine 5'-phosphate oxidase family protein [Granulosicoccus sp.]